MKKSFVSRYIKNKYTIIGIIIVVVIGCILFFTRSKAPKFDFVSVQIGDIYERVSVTGKISPIEKADLAFEKSGKVISIKVKVGDRVKKGDLLAVLDSSSDRASLNSAQAKLSDLSRGLNAPELALEESKIKTASVSLQNAKQDALNTARSAFVLTQTAINNYADNLFDFPQSANPTINVRTASQSLQNTINKERVIVSETFAKWKSDLDSLKTTDDASTLISRVNTYENTVKVFMDRLSMIVNDLNTPNSGLSRTVIDTNISLMNTGLTTLSQAISSVASAKSVLENATTNYDQIYNNYLLKNSGSSAQAVLAQRAVVDGYRVELEKNNLVSPIDGVVTKVEPDIGEYVSPGMVSFGVISDGDYKIEAYVPEADIAKIKISDQASTTLDAYGQNVDFPSVVVDIDPAETILEGVPTYRIVMRFVYKDSRIKSGMTANLDIMTNERKNVLVVPTRAIQTEDNKKYIRVVKEDGKSYMSVPIVVGLKGSDGMSEIISGIKSGDKIVTYIK
jgi:HlyD family secretion protein